MTKGTLVRWTHAFVATVLSCALLAVPPTAGAGSGTADDPWVLGMSQSNLGEPWRVQMDADLAEAADARSEVRIVFKDAQNDTLRQRAQIEEFVGADVDLLIVSPKEVALTPVIARAYASGTPVIVLDRRVAGDQYTQYIGGNNRRIGEAAGRWIADRLGGGGTVVELKGLMTSTPAQDRHGGFRDGIAGTALDVIFEADMQWLLPNAQKEMESALARFPAIDVVYAHNDPAAQGAWLAARAAGREDDTLFVGIDGLPHEGQAFVKRDILDACFEYPNGAALAIEHAIKVLRGEEVPKEIEVPSRVYTPENIGDGGEWLDDFFARIDSEAAGS